ncbi:MAG: threonine synthase [Deltaproteobacteria bacterium]|nr:threonine synthase [Deltaproteobacteria bacterium]
MKIEQFPDNIRPHLIPEPNGRMVYQCLGCSGEFPIHKLLYTCPDCGQVLLLHNKNTASIDALDGPMWRKILDYRRMLNQNPLKGIFRYYEFIAPVIPLNHIIYLGEGHTPLVKANPLLTDEIGTEIYFKNDGLNPSASFKDRGMACALSYINFLSHQGGERDILAICASTGDTSASAALYAAYLQGVVKSAVLLPKGKVTPQQLSQPLGSGAVVLEIPGVFDDCMKVVEALAETYHVALLNSKNSWRILGQESFSFEVAQDFDYDVGEKVVTLPIGNAGNITAVMSGFLKFLRAGLIERLPKIVGVQSAHADPVYRYYSESRPQQRRFEPVTVKPSVAQAAMIGNPVSMPRVIQLVEAYNEAAGEERVFVVQVTEQEIMDAMIRVNQNGHIACTQGGESFAGFKRAMEKGFVSPGETGVLDSTAHVLKFSPFQEMYLTDRFDPEFEVKPRTDLKNMPLLVNPPGLDIYPQPGKPLKGRDMDRFLSEMTHEIADILKLEKDDS